MAITLKHHARRQAKRQAAPAPDQSPERKPKTAEQDWFESLVPWYHQRVIESLDATQSAELDDEGLTGLVSQAVRQLETAQGAPAVNGVHADLARRLVAEMRGLGPLEPLMRDPEISDILVNGLHSVYIERHGRLQQVEVRFRDVDHLTRIAQRIAEGVGRHVDELSPMCDARLPDGSRVNIIVPPLAIDGAAISIRRFRREGLGIGELVRGGAMHRAMATLLELAARVRLNVVVSGGTGAGKTTMLNALSAEIDGQERIVTLEDAAELSLRQPHVVRLETRAPSAEGSGEVKMRDLLKNALRMRPDRIIVGEVRGGEAVEALQAMNTGHPGSMMTIHANGPRDAVSRLEYLVMMGAGDLPLATIRAQVISAVDLIVHVSRFRDGKRRITAVTDVMGLEGDVPVLEDLWTWEPREERFLCSRGRPSFAGRVEEMGYGRLLAAALRTAR